MDTSTRARPRISHALGQLRKEGDGRSAWERVKRPIDRKWSTALTGAGDRPERDAQFSTKDRSCRSLFGQKRTLQSLRRSYFGIGMARNVRTYCQSCLTCQKSKAFNRRRVPLQRFKLEGVGPGDLVAMDIATLPWSDGKFC